MTSAVSVLRIQAEVLATITSRGWTKLHLVPGIKAYANLSRILYVLLNAVIG